MPITGSDAQFGYVMSAGSIAPLLFESQWYFVWSMQKPSVSDVGDLCHALAESISKYHENQQCSPFDAGLAPVGVPPAKLPSASLLLQRCGATPFGVPPPVATVDDSPGLQYAKQSITFAPLSSA